MIIYCHEGEGSCCAISMAQHGITTSERSSAAFLAKKNIKFFFRTKHRTRKKSSVS